MGENAPNTTTSCSKKLSVSELHLQVKLCAHTGVITASGFWQLVSQKVIWRKDSMYLWGFVDVHSCTQECWYGHTDTHTRALHSHAHRNAGMYMHVSGCAQPFTYVRGECVYRVMHTRTQAFAHIHEWACAQLYTQRFRHVLMFVCAWVCVHAQKCPNKSLRFCSPRFFCSFDFLPSHNVQHRALLHTSPLLINLSLSSALLLCN